MSASIKTQIVARLFAVLEPLKQADPPLRKITRRTGFFIEEIVPSLDVIIGDEEVQEQEDMPGYEIEFPVFLKLNLAGSDIPTQAEQWEAAIQTVIETDAQLAGLANWIKYKGNHPFTNEASPDGGSIPHYIIAYRRQRAQPAASY